MLACPACARPRPVARSRAAQGPAVRAPSSPAAAPLPGAAHAPPPPPPPPARPLRYPTAGLAWVRASWRPSRGRTSSGKRRSQPSRCRCTMRGGGGRLLALAGCGPCMACLCVGWQPPWGGHSRVPPSYLTWCWPDQRPPLHGPRACRALVLLQPCPDAAARLGCKPSQDARFHDHRAAKPAARLLRPKLPARASGWGGRQPACLPPALHARSCLPARMQHAWERRWQH